MKIFKVIVLIWVLNWAWFSLRPFIKDKDLISAYISLARADPEGKRAIVFGKEFYQFLKFCKQAIPEGSTYRVAGLKADSIELVRLIYYLYPCLVSEDPDFVLVYQDPDFNQQDMKLYSRLNQENFIFKTKRQ